MADDNSARYRSTEPFGGGGSATPANDLLAELARLIGRGDPLADNGRDARAPAQPPPDTKARHDEDPAPSFLANPTPQYPSDLAPQHYSDPAPQHHEPAPHYDPSPQQYQLAPQQYGQEPAPQHYSADPAPRYSPEYPTHNGWPGLPPAPQYSASDPFVPPSQQYAPAAPAPHHGDRGYAQPNYGGQPYADPRGRPGMENHFPDRAAFSAADFPAPPERPGYAPPLYPQEPEAAAGGMPPLHDDGFYDDRPRGGRRKGLLTVVAVLGFAVIGTAGAFGYRTMVRGSGSLASPPVIRASAEPSKVAPPAAAPDASASKFSYDRFGDAGKDERVVRREEKPVDLTKVAPPPPAAAPRPAVAAAPPVATEATPAKPANPATTATAATAAANPPSAIGEPRRVRTVPIRPDQGGDAPAQTPAQRPMNTAALAPPARAAARSAAQAPVANAPLSLAPEAKNALALPPQDNPLPPPSQPRAAAAPPPPARVAPASGGGSYLVQVSSQKSEADAESAYRGIKSKYSSVLGSHPHQVRRADLGAKGVFYRAVVGPFGSREEAVQVCSSLKQAGGDCVVQH